MLLLVAALPLQPPLRAQETGVDTEGRAPVATRADLQAQLAQAEQIASSTGYSDAFRSQKRQEATQIQERLTEGDFLPGDQIILNVMGDTTLSGTMTIGPGRVLSLAGLPDISLRGVLRSEIQPYLLGQIGRYLKDPEVKARALIRLSVLGGVGQPGFYQLDADMLLADALTKAGGIGNTTELQRSSIKRNDQEIVDGAQFVDAIAKGQTLDQLNLRAGDVIDVGIKPTKDWFSTLRTAAIIPGLIVSTYGLGKLLGVF
ncbi:MAG TPA: SLBB domain-containing protein [Gemmatimonadales bacterium]|nr:SLBB domain-containing protein [Gemmatimonadales bacterium]